MVRESRHIDSIIGLLWCISKLYLKFILAVFLSPVYSTPSVFFLLLNSLPFLCYSFKQNDTAFYLTTFLFLKTEVLQLKDKQTSPIIVTIFSRRSLFSVLELSTITQRNIDNNQLVFQKEMVDLSTKERPISLMNLTDPARSAFVKDEAFQGPILHSFEKSKLGLAIGSIILIMD